MLYMAVGTGLMIASLSCFDGETKKNKKNGMKYQAPKNQVEIQSNEAEREMKLNLLEDNYINTFFSIENCQKTLVNNFEAQNDIGQNMKFLFSDAYLNTQKLLAILEQTMVDDMIDAHKNGLTEQRLNELALSGGRDISYYEKMVLENILTKHEVGQFLYARNMLYGVETQNTDIDFEKNNEYLSVIKNNDFRKDSKAVIELAKRNILGIETNNNNESQTEKADHVIYFDDLELFSRVFILSGHIPEIVGVRIRNCLALDMINGGKVKQYIGDAEENGYDVDSMIKQAQDYVKHTLIENNTTNQNVTKKKSKFVNQSIKLLTQIDEGKEISK